MVPPFWGEGKIVERGEATPLFEWGVTGRELIGQQCREAYIIQQPIAVQLRFPHHVVETPRGIYGYDIAVK
jgi:hypothetical protein